MDFNIILVLAMVTIVSMYCGIQIGRHYNKQPAITNRLIIACKLAVAVLCEPDIQSFERPFLGHITPQYALYKLRAILAELGESESIGP